MEGDQRVQKEIIIILDTLCRLHRTEVILLTRQRPVTPSTVRESEQVATSSIPSHHGIDTTMNRECTNGKINIRSEPDLLPNSFTDSARIMLFFFFSSRRRHTR